MSSTARLQPLAAERSSASRTVLLTGLSAGAIGLAATAWGAHDSRDLAILTSGLVLATATVFGVIVPRALRRQGAGKVALWLSLPAVLILLPLFWSGLPMILGSAGALVGLKSRQDPTGRSKAVAGLVLGFVAVLGYVAIYLVDGLLLGNI